jgi:uncharacterized protein involved in high-affinity Fe2+ transport
VSKSKVGPIVAAVTFFGVALIFWLNFESGKPTGGGKGDVRTPTQTDGTRPGPGKEHPIGDDVVKNHLQIAAVWLDSVSMAGMPEPSSDVIHLEADVKSTADNPNGYAKDEFVAYLKVKYEVVDAASGKTVQSGDLLPMIASDGQHYGANIAKPAPGSYRLVYKIEPPSAGGLGRHVDVAPWWEPFEVSFDWLVEPVETKAVATSGR